MADGAKHIERVVKEEGGFQNDKTDTGNFYNSVNYGTKYGITPGAWVAYYKKPLQPDTIKNLTVSQAAPIYKKNYWDKMRGDEIENDSVAALMFFTVVNSGVGQVLTFKKIINALSKKTVVTENTNPLTSAEVKILNGLDQSKFFELLKATREKTYRDLAAKSPDTYGKYLKGWLNRLNEHVFIAEKKSLKSSIAIVLLLILLTWFIFFR